MRRHVKFATHDLGRLAFTKLWAAVVGLLLICGICPTTSRAGQGSETPPDGRVVAEVSIESVEVGFDGRWKLGRWIPLFVSYRTAGASSDLQIEVVAPDGNGVPTRAVYAVADASSGESAANIAIVYAKIGRATGDLQLSILDGDRPLATRTLAISELGRRLPSGNRLVCTIGAADVPVDAVAAHRGLKARGVEAVAIDDVSRFPDRWIGFEGVDTVVLFGRFAQLAELAASPSRIAALQTWLENGGRLVVSVHERHSELFSSSGPLATFVPGELDRFVELPQLSALEVFANSSDALLRYDKSGNAADFNIARIKNVRGQTLVAEGRSNETPLIVHAAAGFGEIIFVGVDLEQEAFADWNGTRELIARLVYAGDPDFREKQSSAEIARLGYRDLAGQLRAALENFEEQGVRLLSFESFFILALFYVLLIGPGDYFFLKKWVGRLERTWLTFSLIVFVVCGAAYGLAVGAKGRDILVNQYQVLDYDLDRGRFRATNLFSVFSPQTARYELQLDESSPISLAQPTEQVRVAGRSEAATATTSVESFTAEETVLSWFGVPGPGLGGMESTAPSPRFVDGYWFEDGQSRLKEVPIQVWSTKSFMARSTGSVDPPLNVQLTIPPGSVERVLSGTIENQLEMPLTGCILFFDRWAYSLGTIASGTRFEISDETVVRTVERQLTRLGDWAAEDEQRLLDLHGVMRRMIFYNIAGGDDFTELDNEFFAFVDLSGQLAAGRAVMIAVVDRPAFGVAIETNADAPIRSRQQALVRFVFSIDSSE